MRQHQRDRLPDAVFVQQTVHLATAEQLPGVALCLFGNFHFCFWQGASAARPADRQAALPIIYCRQLFLRFLGQPPLVVRRQNFAGDRRGRLHDQPANFTFQLGEHPLVFQRGGFARPGHDLFRGGDGFLRFLLAHARGGDSRFLDQLVGQVIGLVEDFPAGGLGPGQFRLDFFRVLQAFRNALTALFEDGQNGFVGKPVQQARRRSGN